ncbi:MAG: HAD family hydrolase [Candidatus Kapaibacterium sp.]
MSLKVITIDFWNTLFDSSNGTQRNTIRQKALIGEIEAVGRTISSEEFNSAMQASWEFFNNIWKNEYRTPDPAETVRFFWSRLDMPHSEKAIAAIVKAFAESILDYPPRPMQGVRRALDQLAGDYRLGIVSDTGFSPGKVLKELLYREDMLDYFEAFSFSDETKVSKPHEKAFLTVLDRLGCNPADALHIGDIEETDVAGAKKLGMMAIRFTGDETAFSGFNKSEKSFADSICKSWDDIIVQIDDWAAEDTDKKAI